MEGPKERRFYPDLSYKDGEKGVNMGWESTAFGLKETYFLTLIF